MCKLGGVSLEGAGSSKKEAKRKSASEMLKHLSEAPEGARALVFSTAVKAKDEEAAGGDEVAKLGKSVQQLSLDVKAAKLLDLQNMSLKNRWVSALVVF